MRHFVDDDAAYLAWLADHPDGFVVNTTRNPSAAYLMLHRATCRSINGSPARGSTFTGDYTKLCGSLPELEAYAGQLGGTARPCGQCLRQHRPAAPWPAAVPAGAASAQPGGEQHKPRWRSAVSNAWTVAIGAPLIVLAVTAATAYLVAVIRGDNSLLTGSVTCESGRSVTGVWIAASSGQGDSGFAHLGPAGRSAINFPAGSSVSYSYRLPHGGSYSVHVGCGGTASQWASKNFSPAVSARAVRLFCSDPAAAPANGEPPEGPCRVAP